MTAPTPPVEPMPRSLSRSTPNYNEWLLARIEYEKRYVEYVNARAAYTLAQGAKPHDPLLPPGAPLRAHDS